MEGLLAATAFADLVAAAPGFSAFTLLDIGCAGGIDSAWRRFGPRLAAFAFDPDLQECERLQRNESHPGIHYVPAFVAPGAGHPFLRRRANTPIPTRNVWFRLSGPHALGLRRSSGRDMAPDQLRAFNLWQQRQLADPGQPLALPAFALEHGITDVDFIKIDVDGEDFAILNAIAGDLRTWNVLGLGLEVSFDGSEGDTEQSFHNTDRFMRAHGFDLFGLSVRRYSLAALPGIFAAHMPAETLTGRPQLGDAIYLRDLADPRHRRQAAALEPGKLLKLAAIASLAASPDLAADILLTFRDRLEPLLDITHALDLLAAQVQSDVPEKLGFAEWMAAFRADSPLLYRHSRAAALSPPSPRPPPDGLPRQPAPPRRLARLAAPLQRLAQLPRRHPAARPEGSGEYAFSSDWFSGNIYLFERNLAHLMDTPCRILEIGSFEGRSTIWMLEHLARHPEATITCVDVEIRPALQQNIERTGRRRQIALVPGRSGEVLRGLGAARFDFIYVDGSHARAEVLEDAVLAFGLARAGAIIAFDDYLDDSPDWNPRDFAKPAIDAFLDIYRSHLDVLEHCHQVWIRKHAVDATRP